MRLRERPVLVLAWTSVSQRQVELAAVLPGEALAIYPRALAAPRRKALRYLLSAALTLAVLVRRRPRAVVVTNPPVPAAVLVVAWSLLSRSRVVLDSHPGGFGAMGDTLSARLQPLHRWAARRAAAVAVTTEDWVRVVQGWGGTGFCLHEPVPGWTTAPAGPRTPGAARVLFPGIYGRDEPVETVVAAARLLPEVEVQLTGDVAKAPPGLLAGAPPSVRVLGYLDQPAYRAAVRGADVVLSLTTDATSIMRTACEATYARRPLVVSDWPRLREVFPAAVHAEHEPAALAAGVRAALELAAQPGAETRLEAARQEQVARWEQQLGQLRSALGLRTGH